MELLDHRMFYGMVLSGAHKVIFHQKELNDTDFLPVYYYHVQFPIALSRIEK